MLKVGRSLCPETQEERGCEAAHFFTSFIWILCVGISFKKKLNGKLNVCLILDNLYQVSNFLNFFLMTFYNLFL